MTGSGVLPGLESELFTGQYHFVDSLEISKYLQTHPHLVTFFLEAHSVIERHFPQMPITIQVMRDPEGGSGMLFGLIQSPEEAEATLPRLEALDTDPEWISMYTPVRSLLIISVEYV